MSEKVLNLPSAGAADAPARKLTPVECVELSQSIRKLVQRIKGEYMMSDCINYKALGSSQLYADFQQSTRQLACVDLDSYSEQQRKAFFINVYNTLTIHGVLAAEQLPDSVLKVQQFWKNTCYNIGGHVFSLDDIEHGILRANRSHPASAEPVYFPEGNVKAQYSAKELDPRIHFALNCGAKSCPVISAYHHENLDEALDTATRNFCRQEIIILPKNEEVYVSKIFEWYGSDFGKDDVTAIRWTLPYLEDERRSELGVLLQGIVSVGKGAILYNEYDWGLNSSMHS